MITGFDRTSSMWRKRRLARLIVPAIGLDTMAAGYMEMLKRYLDGVHLIRLESYPINWHMDVIESQAYRQSQRITWRSGSDEIEWETEAPETVYWYNGTLVPGTVFQVSGQSRVSVSNLPARRLVARPGEFVTLWQQFESTPITAQIVSPMTTNGNGEGVLRLFEEVPTGEYVRVNIGSSQTALFRPQEYPRAVQPARGNWEYEWNLREIFADEVGGITEVNPW